MGMEIDENVGTGGGNTSRGGDGWKARKNRLR